MEPVSWEDSTEAGRAAGRAAALVADGVAVVAAAVARMEELQAVVVEVAAAAKREE